jgi:hypothetical protein
MEARKKTERKCKKENTGYNKETKKKVTKDERKEKETKKNGTGKKGRK